ncbi:MAG: phage tail tip lysozyme [Candidatus Saccharimonadales bacterium]
MSARYNAYNQEYAYQRAGNASAGAFEAPENNLIESSKSFAITALAGIAILGFSYLTLNGLTKYGGKFAENSKKVTEIELASQESIAARALDGIRSLGSKSISEAAKPVDLPIAEVAENTVEESSIAARMAESVKNMTKSEKIEIVNTSVESVGAPVAETAAPNIETKQPEKTTETIDAKYGSEDYIWNYFRSRGYTPVATAAIMGNFKQESGLKPKDFPIRHVVDANGEVTTFGGASYANYNGGRREKFYQYARETGRGVEDPTVGLDFAILELNGRYRGVKEQIQNTEDLRVAVEVVQNQYEVCKPGHCNPPARLGHAQKYLNMFSKEDQ